MKPGWPIQAYLTGLAASSVAAALLVALAMVTLLPPRPTGAWQINELTGELRTLYAQAAAGEPVTSRPRLRVSVTSPSPRLAPSGFGSRVLAQHFARALQIPVDRVLVGSRPGAPRRPVVFRSASDEAAWRQLGRQAREQSSDGTGQPDQPSRERAERLSAALERAQIYVYFNQAFRIAVQLPDGQWLVLERGHNWALLHWIGRAALLLAATSVSLTLIAALFARRLAAPIRQFAEAVRAVGVDPGRQPVAVRGPREVREAAQAVNVMQARLRALIADRTRTLATVAHDMRTPLMRLRLAAETVEPQQQERIAKEIKEVEALVASFIAFARDDPAEESRVRLDLAALVESLVQDRAAQGAAVRYSGVERLVLTGQSLALKRLVSNLLDNALKFGARSEARVGVEGAMALIEIEDDGPGVPEAERERIFEPFVRLEQSGVQGAGLGLAAARSIARAHGGEITALASPGGGALMQVRLPL